MKKLSIKKLSDYLGKMVDHNIKSSMMIWGAPGIGKSSVVASVAKDHDLELIDLRISQLAPTDLRGIPVPTDDKAHWYPPEFLPTEGKGILFLDEINQPIFDAVLIICPDPWPKLKHHKRRMINSEFLDLTHKVLKLSGHLFMSTDWENYAESIEESINQNSIFVVLNSSPYEYLKLTKFQQRAIEEGRKIYPFSLKKIS